MGCSVAFGRTIRSLLATARLPSKGETHAAFCYDHFIALA